MVPFTVTHSYTPSSCDCAILTISPHARVAICGSVVQSSRRLQKFSLRVDKSSSKLILGLQSHRIRDRNRGSQLVSGIPSFVEKWQTCRENEEGIACSAQSKDVASESLVPSHSDGLEEVSADLQRRPAGIMEPIGVVIVDHGSRRQASNNLLHAFVEMYKEETGRQLVEPAHMELCEPSIATAFTRCVEQGARTVIISPYFLSPGRHWSQDIPELAAAAAERHPGVAYLVAAPIGLHSAVANVVEERIQRCLSHAVGEAEECSMCAGSGACQVKIVENVAGEVSAR